ncbi:MAG: sulfatase-like hydrolase/transferase, partial [Holophagales bacterium]|nr:sulfatase-like hydrolase/transferase [Holophagales bacterium]
EIEPKVGPQLTETLPEGEGRAVQIHRDALAFLDAHQDRPSYLWIHHNDVHWPYGPTVDTAELFADEEISAEELRFLGRREHRRLVEKAHDDPRSARLLSRLYDCGLRTFDTEIGRFFAALDERGLFEPAAILLTADHGEEFWEHGSFGHGSNLFTESTSVPMILKLPGQTEGSVIETPVSLLDVGPTVLELAGRPSDTLPGVSLLSLIHGAEILDRPILGELVRDGYELTWSRGRWKLRVVYSEESILEHLNADGARDLEPQLVELYDVQADPAELIPLDLAEHGETVARLRAELEAELDGFMNYSLRLRREVESGRAEGYELPLEADRNVHRRLKGQLEALGYI